MKLKEQLQLLADVGLTLSEGLSINDLLISFSEKEFEERPFDLLLYMLGGEVEAEPYGRPFSSFACTIDMAGIHGDGDYTAIAKQFKRVAGDDHLFDVTKDHVDFENRTAQLRYEAGGSHRDFTPEVIDTWADPYVVTNTIYLISYLQGEVKQWYLKANGNENVFYYVTKEQGEELIKLSQGAVDIIEFNPN